ncbi:MAG: hypothetical protein R3C14_22895 [Caldilineaceae bacterium]
MYEYMSHEASQARFKQLLQDAEHARLVQRVVQRSRSRWMEQGLLQLSQWLINTGFWLKHQVEMHPSFNG